MTDPDSFGNHYRRLIALRRQHEVISNGTIQPILEDQEGLIAYRREGKEEQLLCITSLLDQPETVNLEDIDGFAPVLSSYPDLQPCTDTLNLRPYESIVYLRNRKTK